MKESTEQVYRQRTLRVQMFIQQHLDRDLPLEELARESYFSEYHFHRIFRVVVGEPGGDEFTTRIGALYGTAYILKIPRKFAGQKDLEFHDRHHDTYLSDPRRIPPERLKTILRHPVRKRS